MAEREQRCETCRFWEHKKVKGEDEGYCHRSPPRLSHAQVYLQAIDCKERWPNKYDHGVADPDEMMTWYHPVTLADDWCGEWQSVPSADVLSSTDKQLAIAWGLRDKFPERTIDNLGRVIAHIRQLIKEGYSSEADLKRRIGARKNSKRLALISEIRARLLGEWQPTADESSP